MTEMRHNQTLLVLAKEINAGEDTIEEIREQVLTRARQAIPEIILQGQRLICARAHIPSDQWENWLAGNCPKVTPPRAAHYIHRAQRTDEALTDSKQICLLFYKEKEVEEAEKPDPSLGWPADLEGLNRMSRAVSFFERHPLAKWTEVSKKRLREIWEPVAKELWPERFQGQ